MRSRLFLPEGAECGVVSQTIPAARSRVWSQGGRRRYARPVYRHSPREMNARAMVSNSAYEARSGRLGVTCVANFMRWRPRPLRRRNSHWIHLYIGVCAGALSSHEHQNWSRLRTVAVLLSLSCGNWMVAARRQARLQPQRHSEISGYRLCVSLRLAVGSTSANPHQRLRAGCTGATERPCP